MSMAIRYGLLQVVSGQPHLRLFSNSSGLFSVLGWAQEGSGGPSFLGALEHLDKQQTLQHSLKGEL